MFPKTMLISKVKSQLKLSKIIQRGKIRPRKGKITEFCGMKN